VGFEPTPRVTLCGFSSSQSSLFCSSRTCYEVRLYAVRMYNVITRNLALLVLALASGLALGAMAKCAYDVCLIVAWMTGS